MKKTKLYYTSKVGHRNNCGHVTTTGEVYIIGLNADNETDLIYIGYYKHQSGGADISLSILRVAEAYGIDTSGGYYKKWRDSIDLINI